MKTCDDNDDDMNYGDDNDIIGGNVSTCDNGDSDTNDDDDDNSNDNDEDSNMNWIGIKLEIFN